MNDVPSWHLTLLGPPNLTSPHGEARRLEGKTLAVLAYLALESFAPRARLAALLWPDRTEVAARNNLVQLLRRMKSALGDALVLESDTLTLAPHVRVDVRDLDGDEPGALLEGVTFGVLDLDDWLTAWRERLDARRVRGLSEAAARAEERGDLAEALRAARRALALDARSEEAHRRVMRLLYLQGDAASALAHFEVLRGVLRDEWRAEPMPETLDLVRVIRRGDATPARRALPARAPVKLADFVGRERELADLEAAWQAGRLIVLSGPPGMGKSRLAAQFTSRKGRVLKLEGRPGDALVPYTATTRNLRRALLASGVELPPHVRRALSFLLPELALPGEAPPESASPDLHDAARAAFAAALQGVDVCVFDDVQYADEASLEVAFAEIGAHVPLGRPGGMPRVVVVHREGELPPRARDLFEELVRGGQAARVAVPPLEEAATRALLEDLGVPSDAAPGLARASNGHPLFLVEGAGALAHGGAFTTPSGVPPKLAQLIAERLARLSKTALQVARGCAVLRRDFTPDLVAQVLSVPLLDVVDAWDELERERVLTGDRFHHDLVADAVQGGTSATVRRLLHRGAARALSTDGAAPARVAWHWREGGQDAQAAPWLVRAGEAARASLRFREAAAHFEDAARILETSGDPQAFDAWSRRAQAVGMTDDSGARQEAVNDVLERARTPEEVARGWHLQAELYVATHEGERAERAVRRGLAALEGRETSAVRALLLADLGAALWSQGRLPDAEAAVREAVASLEGSGERADLASNLSNLAVILDHQDRHREARALHVRACALLEDLGEFGHLVVALRNLSVCLSELGEARGALDALQRVEALRETGSSEDAALTLVLGLAHADLGEYDRAIACLEGVVALDLDPFGWLRDYARGCLGELLIVLGDFERARDFLTLALQADIPDAYRVRLHAACARLAVERGEDPSGHLQRANAALGGEPRPFSLGRVRLVEALAADANEAASAAREALDVARAHELGGLELAAHARLAAALLRLGAASDAAVHAREAARRLDTLEPADVTRGEVLLTWFDAETAVAGEAAPEARRRALAWLDEAAAHVPATLREAFRVRPAAHRRIHTNETVAVT